MPHVQLPPTIRLSFGSVPWLMQLAEDMVVFSEQSGFCGRTKQVIFHPHPGIAHELCVETRLQTDGRGPLAKHVQEMMQLASFILGLDRFCERCWRVLPDQNPCEMCEAKDRHRRARCNSEGHDSLPNLAGEEYCTRCGEPLNEKAQIATQLPEWLRRINNEDFERLNRYRLERWGLKLG